MLASWGRQILYSSDIAKQSIGSQEMPQMLAPTPANSQQKIASTEHSRDSASPLAPGPLQDNRQQFDERLRLFTFMNTTNQQLNAHKKEQGKTSKAKAVSFKKISNRGLRRESSGLIDLIEQSRKKRENFLKLILEPEAPLEKEAQRKCKTPSNAHSSSSNNFLARKSVPRNAETPRSYLGYQKQHSVRESKSQHRINRAKLSLCEVSQSQAECLQARKPKKTSTANKQNCRAGGTEQEALMKKKKKLEEQLLQINQTLMLGGARKKQPGQRMKK